MSSESLGRLDLAVGHLDLGAIAPRLGRLRVFRGEIGGEAQGSLGLAVLLAGNRFFDQRVNGLAAEAKVLTGAAGDTARTVQGSRRPSVVRRG